jgi:hypothetical protein
MLADICLLSWQICLSLSYPGRPSSHVLADIPLLNSRRHSSRMLVHTLFLFRLAFSHILAGILLRFQQTLLTCPGKHSLGSCYILPPTCFLYLVTAYRSQEQVFSGPGHNYVQYSPHSGINLKKWTKDLLA